MKKYSFINAKIVVCFGYLVYSFLFLSNLVFLLVCLPLYKIKSVE